MRLMDGDPQTYGDFGPSLVQWCFFRIGFVDCCVCWQSGGAPHEINPMFKLQEIICMAYSRHKKIFWYI